MAEETVVAESSAAAAEPEFTQFDGWDEEGTPVVTKKVEAGKQGKQGKQDKPAEADSAAADASKETKPEDAADSAAKKTQETRRKPDAEARIKELAARAKQLEKDLEEARKPKETKADSSTAKLAEEKPGTAPATRPKPTLGDKGTDGKPKYDSYEAFNEDLVDWRVEQRFAAQQREQQEGQQRQSLAKHLEEARGRYTDFDSVTKPLIQEMLKPEIAREVFAVINDSPVLADLLYTIGGTEASKADFLDACRTNPGKALRVALLMEQEIVKELGKGKAAGKKAGEGEVEPAPVKPRAPKPPTEVGGRGAPGEDALISAAKTGDFRSFEAEQTRRAIASRR
jgi:hypothetical protein